jgi:hypothetical protein
MWNLFRKPLVGGEMQEWMLAHVEWLLTRHAHSAGFANAQLVLPAQGFFTSDGEKGHALAEGIFAQIKQYASVPTLETNLLADPRGTAARSNSEMGVQQKALPAGTYQHTGENILITYDSDMLRHPGDLIYVLAHELAHAVLDFGSIEPPPSDEDFNELLTDLTAVFLGFGVFGSYFRSDTRVLNKDTVEEFKSLYTYYMNFNEFAAATALFVLVRGIEPEFALSQVRDDLRAKLKQGFRDWAPYADAIARLRSATSS